MNILHLTDLHFSEKLSETQSRDKWDKIACDIVKGCKKKGIECIVVTGDLTCHGAMVEFRRAEEFLKKILTELGLGKKQIFFCQGNHDADTDEEKSSFEHYEAFLKSFTNENTDVSLIKKGKNKRFAFLSMNTCRETSQKLYEYATLYEEDYNKLQSLTEDDLGILLLHHQPEAIINQDLFWKIVTSGKINLILSGHQHMQEPRVYRAGNVIIVGGMAVTPHLAWMEAGCQIVKIKSDGTVKVSRIDL